MIIKNNDLLNECMYIKKLSSGTKCYIIPKCGYHEKQAIAAFNYGSNDILFMENGKEYKSPLGTAHFLEHKLFEEQWGNVFEEFTKAGAYANAFTDFNKTAYYFSCTEKFNENFIRLLKFIQSPYFTEESTEREKGIIEQEITMYDDDPGWKVFFNMLRAMYFNHTIVNNIAGSKYSIQEIHKDTLFKCYNAFYCPSNMVLVCTGDIVPEEIFDLAENFINKTDCKRAKTLYDVEPHYIKNRFVSCKMHVEKPMFHIGFKLKNNNIDVKKIYGMKFVLDLLFGNSSKFYERAYESGLLSEAVGLQFTSGEGYAFAVIAGTTFEPEKIAKSITEEIKRVLKFGFDKNDFERIKKKQVGRFIRGFNSIDAITMSELDLAMKGFDLFDGFNAVENMKIEYMEELVKEEFKEENMVVSVVKKE